MGIVQYYKVNVEEAFDTIKSLACGWWKKI